MTHSICIPASDLYALEMRRHMTTPKVLPASERPSSFYGIVQPDVKMCEMCDERLGSPHACLTDGRTHSHGMIHARSRDMRLTWICDDCYQAESAR